MILMIGTHTHMHTISHCQGEYLLFIDPTSVISEGVIAQIAKQGIRLSFCSSYQIQALTHSRQVSTLEPSIVTLWVSTVSAASLLGV